MSALIGENSQGQWTLEVEDNFAEDGGAIESWTLNLCSIEPALSIGDDQQLEFVLYPNPNNGSFTVQLNGYSGDFNFRVYDLRGRRIFEKHAASNGGMLLQQVNLNAQAGVYMVEVESQGRRSFRKFILN